MSAVKTTCPYCGVGCGVLASPQADGSIGIQGDENHPANYGRLCVKGAALGETVTLDGRLMYPERGDASGGCTRLSWDQALDEVAARFTGTIAEHGPDSVALYVSGQLLTEDYYAANKLMKGYIGSGNIDTNSRLCMSSAVAAHKRAFGADAVPVCYEDLEQADLIVLVGSNTAWCHPVIFQRILAAKKRRPQMRIVVIDPRRTATCEEADLHLPIKPGTDVWLFNGLLAHLHGQHLADIEFLLGHANGAQEAVQAARESCADLATVAQACGVEPALLAEFYALWGTTEKVITAFSQGVNQSSSGVDKGNAIINCHLLTGRIGKPGMGPFSITGQPNAMGGREVGGLSNQLAAHLDIAQSEHRALVQAFWNSPAIADHAGHKAVDLFEAIHDGRVKAVWIIATNPVVSLPDADRVREALQRCDFVVVSEVNRNTDTAQQAHLLLPAAGWGEKDGTVTNSERRISRQRAFLPLPGDAQPDWWAIAQVAQRMGFSGFEWQSAHEVFLEHARLSAYRNSAAGEGGIPRDFLLAGLTELTPQAYDRLEPIQWPVRLVDGRAEGQARLFADRRYFTADGRAQLVPLVPRLPENAPDADWPLILNTGRVRDHWHSMSRTGKSPRLATHIFEPFVELNAREALRFGVEGGGLARVSTRWGDCLLRVRIAPGMRDGELFAPIHWNDQTAADARIGALVNPVVDPLSGEPEFKHTPARIDAYAVDWHGFVLSRTALSLPTLDEAGAGIRWWTRIQGSRFLRYEIAGRGAIDDCTAWGRQLLGAADEAADWIEARDEAGDYRAALVEQDALSACVFVSTHTDDLPARAWLSSLFAADALAADDRLALLAGRSPGPQVDHGPTVCSCFGVGRNPILAAIQAGCRSPEALGDQLKCGTNCGSCVPELRMLIAQNNG